MDSDISLWLWRIYSTVVGLGVTVGIFCAAEGLWPFNSTAPVLEDESRWRWLKNAVWAMIQIGIVFWVWRLNENSPKPVQPLAVFAFGAALAFAFTWLAAKVMDLGLWCCRYWRGQVGPRDVSQDPPL